MTQYPDTHDQELIEALASLKTDKEIRAFLRDVFTLSEIKEAANRFQIAKALWLGGQSYLEIANKFHTSTTTVTRVARWLNHQKYGGYRTVLFRLYPKV
jgi:TrpR-related protein YerC/YecD